MSLLFLLLLLLLYSLICCIFLGSTYRWCHAVFVFVWLISLSITGHMFFFGGGCRGPYALTASHLPGPRSLHRHIFDTDRHDQNTYIWVVATRWFQKNIFPFFSRLKRLFTLGLCVHQDTIEGKVSFPVILDSLVTLSRAETIKYPHTWRDDVCYCLRFSTKWTYNSILFCPALFISGYILDNLWY